MQKMNVKSRRKFIGTLAASASLTGMTAPFMAQANGKPVKKSAHPADTWFEKVKGDHRIVYDAPEIHDGFPIIWPWAFYMTNNQTGTADDNMTAVVVLRHNAIPLAMENRLWEKYNLGQVFNMNDAKTSKPSVRNPYYEPQEGDFPLPIIDGIKKQMDRGIMYCVCELAISVYSGAVAQQMNLNPEDVKNDWIAGVCPGIQVVPSGVWALGRAHEHNCGYIYAGG